MPEVGENWVCPYCSHAQVITEDRYHFHLHPIYAKGCEMGDLGIAVKSIVCANTVCGKLSLRFSLLSRGRYRQNGGFDINRVFQNWSLLPASLARPQPEYIPDAVRRDYEEACAIRDLSPKASATITRRCIQGMIRDFCGISKKRLIDEIEELRDRVDAGSAPAGVQQDAIAAIDHVRSIGNIGAHMEADINVIVDVDPDEAQKLIELVELLFDEWYIARHQRQQRLAALGLIAAEKKALRQQKQLPSPENATPGSSASVGRMSGA